MAREAVEGRDISIRLACEALFISQNCYRYKPKLSDENAEIADWLVRLTHNQKNWGFGLCFLFLRNVKGSVVVKLDVALSMLKQLDVSAVLPSPGSATRFRPVTSRGYPRSSAVGAGLVPPGRQRIAWPGSRYPARCGAGAG